MAVPVERAQVQGLLVVNDAPTVLCDELILAEGPGSPQAIPTTYSSKTTGADVSLRRGRSWE